MGNDTVLNKQLYFSKPQYRVALLLARIMFIVWGRGGGKSSRVLAYITALWSSTLARGTILFTGPSFRKLVDDLVSTVEKGWNEMGYVEGLDYVKWIKPPEDWIRPLERPGSFKYSITWRTGFTITLSSQDRKVFDNGKSVCAVIADELKKLKREQFIETTKTIRGNREYFKDAIGYGSIIGCSDKFIGAKDHDWFLDWKQYDNKQLQEDILWLVCHIDKMEKSGADKEVIKPLKEALHEMRKQCVVFSESSSLENIHALGVDYIDAQAKASNEHEFNTAILGFDYNKIPGGFYGLLDESTHSYEATNYKAFDKQYITTSRNADIDKDLNMNSALDVSIDFGGKHNFMITAQCSAICINALKNFFVKTPLKLSDLVLLLHNYYWDTMICKEINFFYDPSGNKEVADNIYTNVQAVKMQLEELGWIVNDWNIISYISHNDKYDIWEAILDESDDRDVEAPVFRYNALNCYEMQVSMAKAPMKQIGNEKKKDKSSERKDIPQEFATHLSDTIDNIVCFRNLHLIKPEVRISR